MFCQECEEKLEIADKVALLIEGEVTVMHKECARTHYPLIRPWKGIEPMKTKTGVQAGDRIGTAIEITRQIVCASGKG